ncbi:MAG: hypothetical protein ACRDU8_03520, partial [Egibacteraceae bacterium]
MSVDTTEAPDGRQEFRFSANVVQEGGDRMFQSTGWQAYLENGKRERHYRKSDVVTARGWYHGAEYANASLKDFPLKPVRGIWRPRVQMRPGSDGVEVEHHFAAVDSD